MPLPTESCLRLFPGDDCTLFATRLTKTRERLQLRHEWSPEQIAGWLGRNEHFSISHERIYQHIRRDRDRGGRLHTHLRQQQPPKRVSSKTAYKGSIPHRVSIDDRPDIVDEKTRIGDWEVDLMMGRHGGGGLLTLVDRTTRFTRIEPVLSKHADHVADVIIRALSEIKGQVHTLTMDNGNEFAQHERVAKTLQAKVYFAHPNCAWERGANENTNGLLRQYFPKGTNFKTITQAKIRRAEDRLNDRPRKALEFRSPNDIFQHDKP
ncbi:MAG TPA: IS30 family transposase [Candidatus Handelsmanbacteria bacterium]|nr:IS30 family transposase [Candidatus Handelsmanbacteria bacterium]